jgi:4-phospho-D-threonate 3-dehydrogenase / 4-phospho-D-erythronate 3-dehydrogenase
VSPTFAISVGDPFGIGPEVVLKALAEDAGSRTYVPVVVGDLRGLRETAAVCGLDLDLVAVEPDEARAVAAGGAVPVVDLGIVDGPLRFGQVDPVGGEAAYRYLERAVEITSSGIADALVTAPLHKYALQLAGRGHEGHTEILQRMTASEWSLTMFVLGRIRTVFLTRHVSLADAIRLVTRDRVVTCVERFMTAAPALGLPPSSRIAVAALNPHAGEGGLFGSEEIDELQPAVADLVGRGLAVEGPVPGDSVFHLAKEGRYDMVLSLYHDQAAGILKGMDFHGTVSVTLGLPFLRFSVDHGTAFDLAGTGRADHRNMANTLALAASSVSARAAL